MKSLCCFSVVFPPPFLSFFFVFLFFDFDFFFINHIFFFDFLSKKHHTEGGGVSLFSVF